MFKHHAPVLACCGAIAFTASCDRHTPTTDTTRDVPARSTATDPAPAPKPADNTGRNERDRTGNSPTPIDQGESESDRKATADIRKAVMDREGLSVNAQNCKIICRNGTVTLRGPVKTQEEKDWIESRAKATAGVSAVVNELEVTG